MTAPAWLFDSDDDELADLASVGIRLDRDLSAPEIDATVSEMLGRMAGYDHQIAEADEAERLEVELINARYERRRDPLRARRKHYEGQVLALAQRADFSGKRRSRVVGNGSYGVRSVSERVEITDKALALEWAKQHCPGAVQVETVEKIVHKAIAPAVLARVHTVGELPDGYDVHPAHDAPYCKVEV